MSSPSTPNAHGHYLPIITIDRSQHSRKSRVQHSLDAVAAFHRIFAAASDARLSPPPSPPSQTQAELGNPQRRWKTESLREQPYHAVQSFAYSPRVAARVDSSYPAAPASSCGHYDGIIAGS